MIIPTDEPGDGQTGRAMPVTTGNGLPSLAPSAGSGMSGRRTFAVSGAG